MIDPVTWEVTHTGFQVAQRDVMIDSDFSLSRRIRTQQLYILINPAMGRAQDPGTGIWTAFLTNHCSIIDRPDHYLYDFLSIDLMKLQQEARSLGLVHRFESDTPFYPGSVEQLLYLENQLFKTITFGFHLIPSQCHEPEFRKIAVQIAQDTLTTIQNYLKTGNKIIKSKAEFWRKIHDSTSDGSHTRCDFLMRSLQYLRLGNLAEVYGKEVQMLRGVIVWNADAMLTGHKGKYRVWLERVMAS
jgi:hypothetical protein